MSDEKKIIVDEDWKSQVEAEKRAAKQSASGGEGTPASRAEPEDDAGASAANGGAREMPPASFELLVTMFATEAMVGMGQLPHPITGKAAPDPTMAKYAIDMLEVLAEKTKGNLTADEERGLTSLLHQLRMAFVAVRAASSPSS